MEQPDKGTVRDLVYYRIETAKNDIRVADILLSEKEYRTANNRAYYAIFHAITAVHVLDGRTYKRHKDTLANSIRIIYGRKFSRKLLEGKS